MPESPKNPDRDDRHARRRDEEDSDLDGREAASLLYGGPESTDTDSDNNDDPTDAPSE